MKSKKRKIKIELSEKEFRDLLLLVGIGTYIKEAVDEMRGKSIKNSRKIESKLFKVALRVGMKDTVERFMDTVTPTNKFEDKQTRIIEEFLEENFWDRLVLMLGQRDFWRSLKEDEKKEVLRQKMLPDKVEEFYRKWEEEFEKYGIDRLEVRD